ncbi:MAG: hypothetical protein HWN68_05110 [Desulfobacterales bacterium]|nr:hypothetical protein [Desulfobacterales bacterium]
MADTMDMKIPLAQGTAIKQVHKPKQQNPERERLSAARRRKQKKKKPSDKFADSKGNEAQHRDSKGRSGQDKDSKTRGALLDVII